MTDGQVRDEERMVDAVVRELRRARTGTCASWPEGPRVPAELVVDVVLEERYWYPDDGGVVWLAGYQLVDRRVGRFLGRDAPELTAGACW